MPWPHPAVPSPTLALAGWCPLSPTGAQTTQLLVEPPWRPAVLWDRVTLTCQGSGTTGATTWYKDGQHWEQGQDHFTVTESGTYTCDRPSTGLSPSVSILDGEGCLDWLVLQVPAQVLLEGDTVTLRCWELEGLHKGTELSLSPLWLHHSGRYLCGDRVVSLIPPFVLPIPPWIPHPFQGPCSTFCSPFPGSSHPSLIPKSFPEAPQSLVWFPIPARVSPLFHGVSPLSPGPNMPPRVPFCSLGFSQLPLQSPSFPSHVPHPSWAPVPPVSPHRDPTLGGVPVSTAPWGTGGTRGQPGAELHGGHRDRSPVLLLAPGGLRGTTGQHRPPPGAEPRWGQ
uniref:Uncharacterized protein n=1 Tax=Geospiza parvula TaxID=87175 RepID=A0A8U8AXE8_GEOPR